MFKKANQKNIESKKLNHISYISSFNSKLKFSHIDLCD